MKQFRKEFEWYKENFIKESKLQKRTIKEIRSNGKYKILIVDDGSVFG